MKQQPKKSNANQRPIDDSMKHDISSAADQIPHLIFRSIREGVAEENEEKEQERTISLSAIRAYQAKKAGQDQAKKKLLIFGVLCITLVIISMWIWNMKIFWYRTQELTKDEPTFWDSPKDDLSSILEKATIQKQAIDELYKKVKDKEQKDGVALSDAVNSLLASTTTSTTSTVSLTTTSTPIIETTSTAAITTSTNQ